MIEWKGGWKEEGNAKETKSKKGMRFAAFCVLRCDNAICTDTELTMNYP